MIDGILAKQRRSRIDWASVVPIRVAISQISYERCATAAAMRKQGIVFRKIGEFLGVSATRAQQMTFRYAEYKSVPVQRYFDQKPEILWPDRPCHRPYLKKVHKFPQHDAHITLFKNLPRHDAHIVEFKRRFGRPYFGESVRCVRWVHP